MRLAAFSSHSPFQPRPHYSASATLLNNGMVLVAGGAYAQDGADSWAVLFAPLTQTPPNLVSIAVTPAAVTLYTGATQQFIATGTFSNNSQQQLASVT